MKYSSSGNLIWKSRYNGINNGFDYPTDMVLDDSGNVYVTGESDEGPANGRLNWVTIKYNSNGILVWKQSLDWTVHESDEPFSIAIDKNRNLYVTGFCRTSSFQYERAMVTIKYNNNGDLMWAKSYQPILLRTNWGYSVVTDEDNNVYANGYGAVQSGNETVTIKYSTEGDELWIRKFPTNTGDYLRIIYSKIDEQNNVIVNSNYKVSNEENFVTLKFSSDGMLLWSRIFDNPIGGLDIANNITTDKYSNVYVTGRSLGKGTSNDVLILKYSPDGDTLLFKLYDDGKAQLDEGNDIKVDSSLFIYVTGYTFTQAQRKDFLTITLDQVGNLLWKKTYNHLMLSPNEDNSKTIFLDSYNNVYISGACYFDTFRTGIVTIKYSQFTNVADLTSTVKENEFYNFPNPFNPYTIINYFLPHSGKVTLKVFNALGTEMKTLVNIIQEKGNYQVRFNPHEDSLEFPSGIYFCVLYSNDLMMKSIKIILLK